MSEYHNEGEANSPVKISRRQFLKSTSGLSLFALTGFVSQSALSEETSDSFGPFISIDKDNRIEIITAWAEMGNGTQTTMPMLIAEELDVDFSVLQVKIVRTTDYQRFGSQGAGASAAVRSKWLTMRQFGANVRYVLIQAAAQYWRVPASQCQTENGVVLNSATGRRLTYGQLSEIACSIPYPEKVSLKSPTEFRVIGKPTAQLALKDIVSGKAEYGFDAIKPDMLHCYLSRSPWINADLIDFSDNTKQNNQLQLIKLKSEKADWGSYVFPSVGVIGQSQWAALKAKTQLKPTWRPNSDVYEPLSLKQLAEVAKNAPIIKSHKADNTESSEAPAQTLERAYYLPATLNAQTEPLCCVAKVNLTQDEISVCGPFQNPTAVIHLVARHFSLSLNQVHVETTRIGGSFGRKQAMDFVFEAIRVAQHVKGRWVKTYWTREDDTQGTGLRTEFYQQIIAKVDKDGRLINWEHRTVKGNGDPGQPDNEQNAGSYQGQSNFPYLCDNATFRTGFYLHNLNEASVRAVNYPANLFAVNCMLNDIADTLNLDVIDYHLALLGQQGMIAQRTNYFEVDDPEDPANRHIVYDVKRQVAVIQQAKSMSNWKQDKDARWGFACGVCFSSYAAVVVKLSKHPGNKVEKVWTVIDCGVVVNPDGVKNQLEGGVIWGISQTFYEQAHIQQGAIGNSNYHDYPVARMQDSPQIETHIMPSELAPTGVGEPVVVCTPPAIVNAINSARTNKITRLPIGTSASLPQGNI